jgi:hypothetical protein
MRIDEVREMIRSQGENHLLTKNDHGIILGQTLVLPKRSRVIVRTVRDGRVVDEEEAVWLVGSEPSEDGYRIVMREDGLQFGLASSGFHGDEYPILVGWYGSLTSAFLAM